MNHLIVWLPTKKYDKAIEVLVIELPRDVCLRGYSIEEKDNGSKCASTCFGNFKKTSDLSKKNLDHQKNIDKHVKNDILYKMINQFFVKNK